MGIQTVTDPGSGGLKGFFNSNAGAGVLAGLGGVAGAFPTPASMQGSGTSTTNGSSETNSNTNSFNNSLMDFLSYLVSSSNTNTSGTQSSTPNLSPQAQQLINKLTQSYQQFAKPVDLSGYQATQAQGINRNADLAQQSAQNIMASRGLATSPASATTATNIDANRFAQQNQLNQSIPQLANQQNLANLGAVSGFANALPYGTTSTNSQAQTNEQSQQQNQQQKASQSGGGTAYSGQNTSQNTNQVQNQNNKSGGGIGSAVGGIASVLASLFSDERLKKDIERLPSNKAIDKIMSLKPSVWKWKQDGSEDIGLIAQDLKEVLPELVHKDPNGSGYLKVNYAGLISELVGAVQAVNNKVEAGRV